VTGDPSIRERAADVLDRMARAAARAARRPGEVRLVAVSKTQSAEAVAEAREAGLSVFGENYVQEAEGKIRAAPDAEWHLIGRLQRNKVARAVALFPWIQTVDSTALIVEISRRAAAAGRTVELLAEVNLAGEGSKAGISPEGLPALLEAAAGLPGIRMRGLMAIPPFSEDPEASRPHFARLRGLLAESARRAPRGTEMTELSMGMSHDFEAAIEEGATMVRVGTAIFGPRRTG
jgi:pyridoxal phosphate enzyme (YggS family)